MKRALLVVLCIILQLSTSKAQIYLGPKGGLNLSYLSDGANPQNGAKEPLKMGFNAGLAGQVDLDRFFSLYADLGYSLKGNQIKFKLGEEEESIKFSYHYFQMAVLPRIVIDQDIIRYYVNAGPTVGWLLGGTVNYMGERVKMKFVDSEEYDPQAEDFLFLKDNTNRLEASLSIGGGIMVAAGQGEFTLDLRYDRGLTNIKEDYLPNGEKAKNKNNVISVSVGYLFALDGR